MGRQGKIRTEHSGAKNGGGFWGRREDAKKKSNKLRRENTKKLTQENEFEKSKSNKKEESFF